MIIDLHVHTTKGSGDSSLSPHELVREAQRIGLSGVCVTEHSGWERHDFERFASQQDGLLLVRGLEVETNMGHIIVLGLDGYLPGIADAHELRRAVDRVGGVMIAAHPFRYLFSRYPNNGNLLFPDRGQVPPSVQEAARHPLFELVDAIEVGNGNTFEEENHFALRVCQHLGMPGTGGSDAHSVAGLGAFVTVFQEPVRSAEELIAAIKAGNLAGARAYRRRR